ncbi:hypothetical protein EVC37_21920 [Methylocaldum sp. BRCS4]|uniref:hypothetical protein n=1 Tax=Methylocaldum sp. GT1BW TaxID=3438964 RepID=UPI0012EC95A4|nr:hypothetical protein [Methylocaldum sp. BRCS4]
MEASKNDKKRKKLNNIRLNASTLIRLNDYIPPRRRSAFIREAIDEYLNLPPQNLLDRPRIRGGTIRYVQVPFLISDSQKALLDLLYFDVSISVVVQKAILTKLDKMPFPPPKKHRKMLTRVPESQIAQLKKIAEKPEFGSLRAMNVTLFTRFLNEKPYEKGLSWKKAKRDRAGKNKQFNVLFLESVSDEVTAKIKQEAMDLEVELQPFLYTALVWWLDLHKHEFPGDSE